MAFKLAVSGVGALRNVLWEAPSGVSVVFGANGAGKTTLLSLPTILQETSSLRRWNELRRHRPHGIDTAKVVFERNGHTCSLEWRWAGFDVESLDAQLKEQGPVSGCFFSSAPAPGDAKEEDFVRGAMSSACLHLDFEDMCGTGSGASKAYAMLKAVAAMPKGGLLAFDDFGGSLHPHAIRWLFQAMSERAEEVGFDLVLETHSPVLIDAACNADADSVFVLDRHGINSMSSVFSELNLAQFSAGTAFMQERIGQPEGVDFVHQRSAASLREALIRAFKEAKATLPSEVIAGYVSADCSEVWFQVPAEHSGREDVWDSIFGAAAVVSSAIRHDFRSSVVSVDMSGAPGVKRFTLFQEQ